MRSPEGAEGIALPAGYRLSIFDDLDSTNAEALRRLEAGGGAGEVIRACRQSAGRGRRGRSWQSPTGNLYMTLTVSVPANRLAGQLAFVAALGAGEAIRALLPPGHSLSYKWPNDLMLDDAKLGGILIEGAAGLYALGIGINMEQAPPDMGATCLAAADVNVSVSALLEAVCKGVDDWHRIWATDGFTRLRLSWLDHAHRLQTQIETRFPDGQTARGIFRNIDEEGALVLQLEDGKNKSIATGEVFFATA